MVETALFYRTACELATLIRDGQVTAVQVLQAHLTRIAAWNSQLNAVVTLCEEEAMRDAEAADAARRAGTPLGPLHGVPITLKDGVRVRGMRSTFGGLPPYLRHQPRSDCQLVQRLRQAGAVFMGRTNLPLLALDWQCSNPFLGQGKNPWNLQHTPGGSSGGAAAALAAGFTSLELGSDLGGSIRYPAHCCGVLGLRTTDGLLPLDDVGPEGLSPPFRRLLSFGPMARSLEDLALMLNALLGPAAPPSGRSAQQPPASLRIAVTSSWPDAEPNAATRALLDQLVLGLRRDGHEVDCAAAPNLDVEQAWRVWGTIAGHELWSAAPPPLRNRAGRLFFESYMLRYKLGEGPFARWFTTGLRATPREYEDALAQREKLLRAVDEFFERYHLWLLPVARSEAIALQRRGTPIAVGDKQIPYSAYLGAYTVPTTAYGTPVLTMPIGFAESGLPIGVQVHSARFSDRKLLDTAQRFLSKYITVRVPPALT